MPSKRYKKALELVDGKKTYVLKAAVEILTKFPKAKFNETVDLAFRLGVDPKQSDQLVRGTVPLPHGSGKTVRVLVFAKSGPAAEAAKGAGAEDSYPTTINWEQSNDPAILWTTHAGQETGHALADVLFGGYNPSGRLTQTWPQSQSE